MKSFTDLFIRHPVLAAVVNLAIVLVGWRSLATLPVQQYPNIQSSAVVINTVYYGRALDVGVLLHRQRGERSPSHEDDREIHDRRERGVPDEEVGKGFHY